MIRGGELLNSNVLRMLELASSGSVQEIQPSINSTGKIGYPSAEEMMNCVSERAIEILEYLANENVLRKKLYDKILKCPECGSSNLKFNILCPRCKSLDMRKGEVLEHFRCGYSEFEAEFRRENGKYVCPKCRKELEAIGVDYARLGLLYVCRSCGERFSEPKQNWRCLGCSMDSTLKELGEMDVYSYEFNKEKGGWLLSQLQRKHRIHEFLVKNGYKTRLDVKLKGISGMNHVLDIWGSRVIGERIVGGISEETSFEKVVSLHAIAEDLMARAILLVRMEPAEEMRALAERLNVTILKDEELE